MSGKYPSVNNNGGPKGCWCQHYTKLEIIRCLVTKLMINFLCVLSLVMQHLDPSRSPVPGLQLCCQIRLPLPSKHPHRDGRSPNDGLQYAGNKPCCKLATSTNVWINLIFCSMQVITNHAANLQPQQMSKYNLITSNDFLQQGFSQDFRTVRAQIENTNLGVQFLFIPLHCLHKKYGYQGVQNQQ